MQLAHIAAALTAYVWWGLLPLYFHHMSALPPLEMVAYRIFFAVPVLLIGLRLRVGRKWLAELGSALRTKRLWVCASMLLCNWLVYVWSVQQNRVVETSLGYFINPMVYVLFGILFFSERLATLQQIGISVVLIAISVMVWQSHTVPWIAFVLAFSFAIYGSLHKTVDNIKPSAALTAELIVLLPVALVVIGVGLGRRSLQFFELGGLEIFLAMSAGLVTAVPLLLFIFATEGISLSFIGVMQYLAPTIQFLLAVIVFGEPFDSVRKTAFVIVWCGILLFLGGLWNKYKLAEAHNARAAKTAG